MHLTPNKITIILIFSLSFAVSLFGQSPSYGDEGQSRENVVRVNFSPFTISYDPHHSYTSGEAQIFTAIYEGLVSYNPVNLEPLPGAARTWKVSQDRLTYTFTMHEDARYWNGDALTARHFRDTWLELLSPEANAEYSFLLDSVKGAQDYRTGRNPDQASVGLSAPSDREFVVELEHPAPHFLKVLSHHSLSPIHPDHLSGETGWDDPEAVIGNGPFYIVQAADQQIILRKNGFYWDRANVEADELVISFNTDRTKVTEQFNSGNLHWTDTAVDFNSLTVPNSLITNPIFATSYFFLSAKMEPYHNPDIRKALALLIPWEEIRREEYFSIPTSSLIPEIPSYPEAEGIAEPNIPQALELLDAAGYPEGKGLPDILAKLPEGSQMVEIAGIVLAAWEEHLGVTTRIEEYSFPQYYDQLKTDEYLMGSMTWIGDFADPLTFLQMWTSDSNLNDAGYRNADYDEVLKNSMSLYGAERYEVMVRAEEMLLQQAVVLPLGHIPAFNIVHMQEIDGWYPNVLDIHPFKYIRVSIPRLPPGVAMKKP